MVTDSDIVLAVYLKFDRTNLMIKSCENLDTDSRSSSSSLPVTSFNEVELYTFYCAQHLVILVLPMVTTILKHPIILLLLINQQWTNKLQIQIIGR
jgi:hypothetical protein